MKTIIILTMAIAGVMLFMTYWSFQYDYKNRDNNLLTLSSPRAYIEPSFTFKSKEYKVFVYEK